MHLKSHKHKARPDWKRFLENLLPCMLAAVLVLATVFALLDPDSMGTASQATLDAKQKAWEAKQQELDTAMVQAEQLLAQLNDSNANTQELLQQAETQNGVVSGKIDELNSAYEAVENKEQQKWVLPMRYTNCSSAYGYRDHPVNGEAKFHSGVDLAADLGTPIVASRSGTVEIAEYLENDAGYWVLIDHMDGYQSAYMHMDRYIVTAGQFVMAGQVIGYCGSSGVATGNHLHFEIRDNNRTVNPASYIDMY